VNFKIEENGEAESNGGMHFVPRSHPMATLYQDHARSGKQSLPSQCVPKLELGNKLCV
jgi:hypothetical protein